ncbi:glucuronate isomerase, partial [Acinetobacter baumannii]
VTDCDVATFAGYIEAHRRRRLYFKEHGATSTDHGHPTARTADLDPASCEALYQRIRHGAAGAEDAELFRAQMLTEMAGLS